MSGDYRYYTRSRRKPSYSSYSSASTPVPSRRSSYASSRMSDSVPYGGTNAVGSFQPYKVPLQLKTRQTVRTYG